MKDGADWCHEYFLPSWFNAQQPLINEIACELGLVE